MFFSHKPLWVVGFWQANPGEFSRASGKIGHLAVSSGYSPCLLEPRGAWDHAFDHMVADAYVRKTSIQKVEKLI
jgi:hypothetical protein